MKTNVNEIAAKIGGLNTEELNELSNILMHDHSMSATLYYFGAVPTAMGMYDEEVDVIMTKVGMRKLMVIKTVKELLGLGIKDAKDLVDSAPVTLKEFATKDEAKTLRIALEGAGATIEIK